LTPKSTQKTAFLPYFSSKNTKKHVIFIKKQGLKWRFFAIRVQNAPPMVHESIKITFNALVNISIKKGPPF